MNGCQVFPDCLLIFLSSPTFLPALIQTDGLAHFFSNDNEFIL
jgi:hypothetical protein